MKEIKPEFETFARIKVVGVGGSGNHAISRMIEAGLSGVDFVAINTDSQDLHHCKASEKIHIGKNLTRGLGAGMNPDVGRQASEENRDEIQDVLKNTDMVFITCGLGGGTGTGAAPIIAEAAKEAGALTVAVVTKPFMFEGMQRKRIAEDGLESLTRHVDTIITIPNDKILQVIDKKTLLLDSFKFADDILRQGIQGISDLITIPGIVNVDFADVKSIMQNTGSSLMGIGKASGENRAVEAAKQAINSPLLELSIDGANGVLFNVSGGADLTMMEINEAANIITEFIDDEARVIFGAVTDENLKKGEIKVTVIATGFSDGNNNNKRISIDNVVDEEINFMNKEADYEKLNDETVFTDENMDNNDTEDDEKRDKFENDNKKNEVENNAFSSKISPVSTDDEYDVPAFIRKKIKKEK
ncbi:MAG: cell division protein FtsZ [Candidatus Pacebacteria bacterium]|nr:cell division protein FtsZ [Candidatus Paceibacterota bacterium]